MVQFKQWQCSLRKRVYSNGNTALELWDDGGPVAVCTVNMGIKLPEDQAYIKDYSENEGMVEDLSAAGIITEIMGHKQTGYVTVPLYKLNLAKIHSLIKEG